jgi:hypothetical protein
MPSKHSFRPHDEECFFPAQPGSRQKQPEVPIRPPKFRPTELSIQDGKLLAQSQILQCQLRTQPQSGRDHREQPQNRQNHERRVSGTWPQKVNRFNAAGDLANDRPRTPASQGYSAGFCGPTHAIPHQAPSSDSLLSGTWMFGCGITRLRISTTLIGDAGDNLLHKTAGKATLSLRKS